MSAPEIGVLALQGSFDLHMHALERAGARGRKVRHARELDGLDGLIVPGGESTVMSGIGRERGLLERIRERAVGGMPLFGTCAGAILLGSVFDRGDGFPERLGLVPIQVDRNAYGRQRESFEALLDVRGLDAPFQAIFIRAPKLRVSAESETLGVEVLARHGDDPVLVAHGTTLLATFHPELTDDLRIHELFLRRAARQGEAPAALTEPAGAS